MSTKPKINKRAKQIGEIILSTGTEHRGELMWKVAEYLRHNAQYFTASCLEGGAEMYGYAEKRKWER